jgi:drug/metabolite transporter (DMT)-like permease
MKNENVWVAALIGVTILWGWSFVAIHESLTTLSASAFNAYRFLVGGLVMMMVLARKPLRISFDEMKDGTLAGVALFLAFALQTTGIAYTTASNASFITGLAVVFTPLFALVLLKVQVNKQQAFGAVVAAVGLALLTINNLAVHLGDVLVLGCAVFTALHIVVLSKVSKNHDAEVLAFIQVAVVGVLSFIWSATTGTISVPHTPQVLTTIVVMGIGGTAIGYFVQTKAQVASAPSRIALVLVLEPVFGGLFGYLLGGDRLDARNLFGALLIIVAMVVTEYRSKTRAVSS